MNTERYNRQTMLSDFGPEAQKKLCRAKVLVVGAGGLGVPVLTYLNAMGVGTLGVVENDVVSITNLHRQVLYSEKDVGNAKVAAALKRLKVQNSQTRLMAHKTFLDRTNALEIISGYDIVVDASDNFPTRYLVNDACVILKKPFVYGALHGFEGQISVFNYRNGPTYRCLYPNMPKADEVPNCNEHGVLGVIPGIVGNLQALETVKAITGVGEPLSGKLLLFDGLSNSFQKIKFSARPENAKIDQLRSTYDFDCEMAFPSVESGDFQKLLETKTLEIIDVRTTIEFHENHIEGARNIPLSTLDTRQNEINFDNDVYVICQSGVRSSKAITKLQKMRPQARLIDVSGGMNRIRAMLLSIENLVLLCLCFFIVATLYSAVGLGGGSSYLALLTLFLGGFFAIRSIALICNLVVVCGSTYLYFKNGHAKLKDFLPFVITSIPLAFLGASFRLEEYVFFVLLGFSLVVSSLFLAWQTFSISQVSEKPNTYPKFLSYVLGGGIGLLSGLVGIGGGIFLAPVLNHLRWEKSIKIAALASFFILVNSLSGLAGLATVDMLALPWKETALLVLSVLLGGQLGIRISLKRLTPNGIKRVTALLVFVVGIRILAKYLPILF